MENVVKAIRANAAQAEGSEALQAESGAAMQAPAAQEAAAKPPRSAVHRNKKFKASRIAVYALLIFWTLFLFLPVYTLLVSSITPAEEASATTFTWFPKHPTLQPYADIFIHDQYLDQLGMPTLVYGFLNTMWITLVPVVVGLIVSGLSAYAYSKLDFPGRKLLFKIAFGISMVPLGAFGIISYLYYDLLGWTESALPLVIPGMFGSMNMVFFLKMYYETVPNEILEAARIDGRGTFGVFFSILMPLAVPAFIAQFIFGFVGGYNSYLNAQLYLPQTEPNTWTLQLALSKVEEVFRTSVNVRCAAMLLGMVPLVVLYGCCQKLFIEGISVGGVKG